MLDFESSRLVHFRTNIAARVPCKTPTARARIEAMALPELLIYFLNYAGRSIPPRARRVSFANGFWASKIATDKGGDILALARAIEQGNDINTYLSKDRNHGFVERSKKSGLVWEPEKDLILNSFGLHHLHLLPKGSGNELVFVNFSRETAFFVTSGNHKSFMDGSVVDAFARVQAQSGAIVKGVSPPRDNFTSHEQMKLARSGVSSLMSVDGQVTIGPSISTSGHAVRHARYASHICRLLERHEPNLDNPIFLERLLSQAPKDIIASEKHFEWWMDFTDLVLIERKSSIGIPLARGFC